VKRILDLHTDTGGCGARVPPGSSLSGGLLAYRIAGRQRRRCDATTHDALSRHVEMGKDLMVIEIQNEVQVRSAPSEARPPRD
jgi:hypothetical protein